MFLELSILAFGLIAFGIYYITHDNRRQTIDLQGKHVVITGGSIGIGRCLAIEAIQQGAHVSIIARNKDRLVKIKDELSKLVINNNQKILIESIDISDKYENTKDAFERLTYQSGPVDVLINNAGVFKSSAFNDLSMNDFEREIKINYLGTVYCTKAVVESMKERRFGRIVCVSSQAGQIGVYGYTSYSASKFALKGFCDALQMELKPFSVYITICYPPDTETPGYIEEKLHMPIETQLINEASGVMKPELVAKKIIFSLKNGHYNCSYGINGFLLSTLTCGTSVASGFYETIIQIITMPLCRIIAIFILYNFDRIIFKLFKNKKQSS